MTRSESKILGWLFVACSVFTFLCPLTLDAGQSHGWRNLSRPSIIVPVLLAFQTLVIFVAIPAVVFSLIVVRPRFWEGALFLVSLSVLVTLYGVLEFTPHHWEAFHQVVGNRFCFTTFYAGRCLLRVGNDLERSQRSRMSQP